MVDLFDIRKQNTEHQRDDVDTYEIVINLKVKELGSITIKQIPVYSGLSVEAAKDIISINTEPKKYSNIFKAMEPVFRQYNTHTRKQSLQEYVTSTLYSFMKSNGITISGMSEDINVPYEQLDEMFFGACSWDLLTLAKIESYYGLELLKVNKKHSK